MSRPSLGSRVRTAREFAYLSVRELSRMTGISPTHLHHIEEDRPVGDEILLRLADALHLDGDVLLACAGRVNTQVAAWLMSDPENTVACLRLLATEAGVADA